MLTEYVDACGGEQEDGFFRPVVYLLTKDGVVEYVNVLRCLMFGNAMICQDPIYLPTTAWRWNSAAAR